MSTKIYNGYKLPLLNLQELMEWLYKFRDAIREKADELYATKMATIATTLVDSYALGQTKMSKELRKISLDKNKISPSFAAFKIIENAREEIKKTKRRNPEFDFECNIVLIPTKDKILIQLFSEQNAFARILKDLGAAEYPYWNNCDRPDDVTQEDWDLRGEEWDVALSAGSNLYIPALAGIQFDPIADYIRGGFDSYVDFVSTLEQRSLFYATNLERNKWFRSKGGLKEDKMSKMIGLLQEFNAWTKTEEGQKAIEKTRVEEVLPKLKPVLSKEDFQKEYVYSDEGVEVDVSFDI